MSFSRIDAPVVTVVALSNCSLLGFALRLRRGRAFLVERLVAEQARDHLRVRGVGEEAEQRLADVAGVVVEQELDPLGVVERALARAGSR